MIYDAYEDSIPVKKDQRPARFLVKCQFLKLKLSGTDGSTAAEGSCYVPTYRVWRSIPTCGDLFHPAVGCAWCAGRDVRMPRVLRPPQCCWRPGSRGTSQFRPATTPWFSLLALVVIALRGKDGAKLNRPQRIFILASPLTQLVFFLLCWLFLSFFYCCCCRWWKYCTRKVECLKLF